MVIKRPGGRHKLFRLLEPIGAGKYITKKTPELTGVNLAYMSGDLTLDQAHHRLKELVLAWATPKAGMSKQSRNESLALRFWQTSPKGASKDRKNAHASATARSGYLEAAKLLHKVDISTATVDEVKAALKGFDRDKQRKLISRVNTLWQWLEKPATQKIPLPRPPKPAVEALSIKEIQKIAEALPSPLNLFCLAAFGCGGRPGEVFAIGTKDLRADGTHVWIDKTWDQKFQMQDTKNGLEGSAYVIKECREALAKWAAVPLEDRKALWRKSKYAAVFQAASGGHDAYILRHSYANHMLSKRATLEMLKTWMRDDMKTIERYYLKWRQSSADIDAALKLFD
jgi:integrase